MKKFLGLVIGFSLLFSGCSKDDDDFNPGGPNPDPSADVAVQDFMWKAMNLWYFWQPNVPDLADTRFATNEDYTAFLAATPDPEDFYFDKLLFADDRFSFFSAESK